MSGLYSLLRAIREMSGFKILVPYLKKTKLFSSKSDLFVNISAFLILLFIAFIFFLFVIKVFI